MSMHNPFAGKTVAVVGDLMVDAYIYGDVERISPEAPVPVVKVSRRTATLGGAANTALNLKTLGAEPLLAGLIGTDSLAETFRGLMNEHRLSGDHLVTTQQPTTGKTRIIARTQQVVRVDDDPADKPDDASHDQLVHQLEIMRRETDTIILADYAKGVIDTPLIDAIERLWAGGHVLVDPKPRPEITYAGATALTPNLKEAEALLGKGKIINEDKAVQTAAEALRDKLKLKHLLITRAEKGMTLLTGENCHHIPTRALAVADVSGAGDTVIAAFAAGLAGGLNPLEAARLANAAAGIVVGKLGTATVSWEELQTALAAQP